MQNLLHRYDPLPVLEDALLEALVRGKVWIVSRVEAVFEVALRELDLIVQRIFALN